MTRLRGLLCTLGLHRWRAWCFLYRSAEFFPAVPYAELETCGRCARERVRLLPSRRR